MPVGERGSRPTPWCCCKMTDSPKNGLAWTLGEPVARAVLRSHAEDFIVEELPACAPHGEGGHAWLVVQKRHHNTEWVAGELARFAGVGPEAVGYAGLKDRHALTTQVFTVELDKQPEPDWQKLSVEGVAILAVDRHRQRLRRGALRENRFTLILREISERQSVEERLGQLAEGVPNYFGPQRFGHGGGNLAQARAMFAGQLREASAHIRSLYTSAARSWLFNQVLSERVAAGSWRDALPGEALIMPGSDSTLSLARIDAAIQERIARGDLQPSGPLWGRGQPLPKGEALAFEQNILASEPALCRGLEKAGLKQQRRALKLTPKGLEWRWLAKDVLQISFSLPPGSYATSVLRELCYFVEAS